MSYRKVKNEKSSLTATIAEQLKGKLVVKSIVKEETSNLKGGNVMVTPKKKGGYKRKCTMLTAGGMDYVIRFHPDYNGPLPTAVDLFKLLRDHKAFIVAAKQSSNDRKIRWENSDGIKPGSAQLSKDFGIAFAVICTHRGAYDVKAADLLKRLSDNLEEWFITVKEYRALLNKKDQKELDIASAIQAGLPSEKPIEEPTKAHQLGVEMRVKRGYTKRKQTVDPDAEITVNKIVYVKKSTIVLAVDGYLTIAGVSHVQRDGKLYKMEEVK